MKLEKLGIALLIGLSRFCNKTRYLIFVGILGHMLLFSGCSGKNQEIYTEEEVKHEASGFGGGYGKDAADVRRKIQVWLVYWDSEDILKRTEALKEDIEGISYFAAYFDSAKKIFIPQSVMDIKGTIGRSSKGKHVDRYLTFVNDLLKEGGGASLKDSQLVYHLLSSPESREHHIRDILEMTEKGDFDGVEIDYEAMKKDMELWRLFVTFVNELYGEASEKGLKLRVVLEPGAPVNELDFIKGPEYVIMCYNLYGYGTVPGPKADKYFLLSMVEKGKALPGDVSFAVANGGFDFVKNSGEVEQISTEEAQKRQSGAANVRRDKKSGCKVYSYADSKGNEHEVWYADDQTLEFWYNILEGAGAKKFSLWRIGG